MNAIYRTILKSSWRILWKARFLWFFGLFATLLGNGGELNLLINNYNFIKDQGLVLGTLRSWKEAGGQFSLFVQQFFSNFDLSLVIVAAISLLILIFIIWLVMVSQGGLIGGIFQAHKKKPVSFHDAFAVGKRKFWPVFSLNLIAKVVVYALLIMIGLPLATSYLNSASSLAQTLLVVLSFIILIPLAIVISLFIRYAIIACVTKGSSVGSSLKQGWKIFKQNWIVSIEVAIMLFIVNILFVVAGLIGVAILAVPFFILTYIFYAAQLSMIIVVFKLIGIIALVLIVLWLGALISTFQHAAWVLLYGRLTEGKVYPKVARLAAQLMVKVHKDEEET